MLRSFRPLVRFWAAVLLLSGAGAAALQALGPPPSGGPVAAPAAPAPEAALVPSPASPAVAATTPDAAEVAPVMAPALAGSAAAALAGSSPAPLGPRKAAPPKAAPSQRAAGDGAGPRYGGADRRAPTRDIWGNPLQPPDPAWEDRPPPGGRGEAGYIGVYTPTPDGTRGYGGADRRAPARDIWGRPLAPPNAAWGNRSTPGGRGDGESMGIYAPTPDGSRVLIRPGQ